MAITMLLLSTSCWEAPFSQETDNENYQLQISLSTRTPSRAFELVEGSEDENFMGGITFALYYDGSFLMDLKDKTQGTEEKNKYQAIISHSEFESAFTDIGKTFSGSLLSDSKFQVLVTANWKSYTEVDFAVKDELSVLWSNDTDYNFDYKSGDSGATWQPTADGEDGIPMFGLSQQFKVMGLEGNIGVNMLRALAKFEVFDVMKVPDSDYPFSIKEVTLSKSGGKGRLIPDGIKNPGWNILTTQVVAPSLPSELSEKENIILIKTSEKLTYKEAEGNYNKWICYIPEMDLNDEDFKDTVLDIELDGAENHAKVSLSYEITNIYENGYILRNGLYRFFVTGLKDSEVGLKAIIEPDPDGDINFISIHSNKWWLHKEPINDVETEVWYKLVFNSDPENEGRSHWEKEWYCDTNGIWLRWNGNSWEKQDKTCQGPYEQPPMGVNSQNEFNDIITEFLKCNTYSNVESLAAELLKKYGKIFEVNGQLVKYIMLNQDVTLITSEKGEKLLPMHRDYIWYGNGHTVKMGTYTNPIRYNIGPVRDIYLEEPNGNNRLYIDKEGQVWDSNGNKKYKLEDLNGDEKSYDLKVDGILDKKSSYFSENIKQ